MLGVQSAIAAEDNGIGNLKGVENLTIQRVFDIIQGLACWFSRVAIIFVVIAILFYGIQMIMSGSSSDRFSKARTGLLYAVIGTLVIFATYTIIASVANAVNPSGDYSNFLPINC